jgi:hypothetical protein
MTAQSPQLESVIKHWSGPGPIGVAGTPSASECILELREPLSASAKANIEIYQPNIELAG